MHVLAMVVFWILVALLTNVTASYAQEGTAPFVEHLVIDGTVNPAVAEFVHERSVAAHHDGARALGP
jgi:membrane-bound ClpP family serine protease